MEEKLQRVLNAAKAFLAAEDNGKVEMHGEMDTYWELTDAVEAVDSDES